MVLGDQSVLQELKLDPSSSEQLHLQLQRQIRDKIQARRLEPGQRLPTNFEISASLNVSYGTVQRAIKSLADHGVVVRRKSQGTFVRETVNPQVVGIFCTDSIFDPSVSPYLSLMARHLSRMLHGSARDMRVYFVPEPWVSTAKSYKDLWHDLDQRKLAGIIALNGMPQEMTALADRLSVPVVGVTVPAAAKNFVWIDYADFCRRAIAALMSQGCRRIALVGFSPKVEGTHVEDLIKIAADEGLAITPGDIQAVLLPDWIERGQQMGRDIDLAAYDAAIIADDMIAIGFTRALAKRGVRVPEDLHLVTMWNQGSPLSLALPTARFEVDLEQMTRRAIDMLDQLSRGRTLPERRVLVKMKACGESMESHRPARKAALV